MRSPPNSTLNLAGRSKRNVKACPPTLLYDIPCESGRIFTLSAICPGVTTFTSTGSSASNCAMAARLRVSMSTSTEKTCNSRHAFSVPASLTYTL